VQTKDFIAEIAPFAVADMMYSNVLASITIAQGIEESASGNHAPGNNLFGIKSTDGSGQLLWTQEFVNGKYIQIQDWFMKYEDWSGSIADHSAFLIRNSRYERYGFFLACRSLDYKAAAKALLSAGYATNPTYETNLINIIEKYGLDQYDREAVSNMQAITDLQERVAVLESTVKLLEKVPAPDWFVKEFGTEVLKGIVSSPLHDIGFWEDVAVTIRFKK
jgi:flagellum-specific peptidoglycan hydrolase FlgJ